MKIHTVFVTYNRLEASKKAISSYLETVTLPFTYLVVDNGSSDGTKEWLNAFEHPYLALPRNHYPGYACNRGWEAAPDDAVLLHRADNDFSYREGWCEEVVERLEEDPMLGQLGLIPGTIETATMNVGGNCVIRRELFDLGLRYDERPWPEFPPGYTEDSFFSPKVEEMGYAWGRVSRQIIDGLTDARPDDPYCQETYAARGISHILRALQ